MMAHGFAEGIHSGLYVMLIAGIAVLFRDDIKALVWRIRMIRRLRTRRKQNEENIILKHLDMLAAATISEKAKGEYIIFASVLIFFVVAFTGIRSFGSYIPVIYGIAMAVIPYMLLRIKLENIRKKASYEGEAFITILLSKYRMAAFNMQSALELLVEDDKMPELCKKAIMPAIMKARATGDREKINEAFAEFDFSINTNWSRMAAYNIAAAFSGGMDVSDALEDIMFQLREARTLAEERKRLNSEAGRLVMFMVPVSYIMSMVLAVSYVGVSPHDLLLNQFTNSTGYGLILSIFFLFLLNTAILKIIRNRRFDY